MVIAQAEKPATVVFNQSQLLEERRFLGGASFWNILQEWANSTPALVELSAGNTIKSATAAQQIVTIFDAGCMALLLELRGNEIWSNVATPRCWFGGV
ncbi:MAG: hypothetical protein JKX83_09715 [Pseudomonadales bacterium]|nr:hypothetical protein [Pseudomonadales bacterium]